MYKADPKYKLKKANVLTKITMPEFTQRIFSVFKNRKVCIFVLKMVRHGADIRNEVSCWIDNIHGDGLYCFCHNPSILSEAGMNFDAVMLATILYAQV